MISICPHKVLPVSLQAFIVTASQRYLLRRLNPSGPLFGDCYETGSSCPNSPSQSVCPDGSCSKNKTERPSPPAYSGELWEAYASFYHKQVKFLNLMISCLKVCLGKPQTMMCAQNNHWVTTATSEHCPVLGLQSHVVIHSGLQARD